MIELVRLLLATLAGALRRLLLENLLSSASSSRSRSAPSAGPRLRARDKLFWLVVRRLHQNWRRHLLMVRPETVLGCHRQGWRLFWRWRRLLFWGDRA